MITVLPNGLIPHLEDRVFLTDGLWFVRGLGCGVAFGQSSPSGVFDYDAQRTNQTNSPDCYASYAMMPIALQWSISMGTGWNVFTEAGAVLYAKTSAPECTPGTECSSNRGVFPSMELGLRYAFDPSAAVVLRLGFPMITLGVAAM